MIQHTLTRILSEAIAAAGPDLGLDARDLPSPELSRPRQKQHGDWSTNIALALAGRAGRPPRAVAEAIVGHLRDQDVLTRVEIAGPGFINLFVGNGWLYEVLGDILRLGPEYGRPTGGGHTSRRVQVEYVSANPTGPLHVGTARNAALGDSVANVLAFAGDEVEREYYFNDAGSQMELFAASVEARYLERFGRPAEIPADGYHGDDVADLAAGIAQHRGDALVALEPDERRTVILREAVDLVMAGIRATLERFGIHMDTWFSESELLRTGAIDDVVQKLLGSGHAYEADGATFFRSTAFGDDKDRVLIRSNGEPTYFAKDCAYVLRKAHKGFDRMIYVWGADHHGTVKRLLGAAEALGVDPSRVEVLLYQLVNLYRGGEPVRMSKRAGDYVTLEELLAEVGADAARYALVSRSSDSTLDFDIELVARQSLENPVYYVQYAHARIASLLRVAADQGIDLRPFGQIDVTELREEGELDLLRKLAELPEMVDLAADALAPHRLTRYVEEVAAAFHRFYTESRVITDDRSLTQARLWLATAAKQVIATALALIGVSAPESMERIGEDG